MVLKIGIQTPTFVIGSKFQPSRYIFFNRALGLVDQNGSPHQCLVKRIHIICLYSNLGTLVIGQNEQISIKPFLFSKSDPPPFWVYIQRFLNTRKLKFGTYILTVCLWGF